MGLEVVEEVEIVEVEEKLLGVANLQQDRITHVIYVALWVIIQTTARD